MFLWIRESNTCERFIRASIMAGAMGDCARAPAGHSKSPNHKNEINARKPCLPLDIQSQTSPTESRGKLFSSLSYLQSSRHLQAECLPFRAPLARNARRS